MYVQVMKQILTLNKNSRYRIVEKPYTIKNLPFIFLASFDFSVESKNYGIVNKVPKNIVNRGREGFLEKYLRNSQTSKMAELRVNVL